MEKRKYKKLRKLVKDPNLFFQDFYQNQKKKLATRKQTKFLRELGHLIPEEPQVTSKTITDGKADKVSKRFIDTFNELYTNKYGVHTYPLLDEKTFKEQQFKLKKFWQPLLDSEVSSGLISEKNEGNKLEKTRLKKINTSGKGKIKVAVFSENFHFMKALYKSPLLKGYIDFREVSYTDITRGFSQQHKKFVTEDYMHSHAQLVGRGDEAVNIAKVQASLARFFPEKYEAIQWADIVWSEWWVHPTVWSSRYMPDDTKLIARCHAYEVFTYWPHFIDFSRINKNIFVGDHIKDIATQSFDNFSKFNDADNHIIRNYVDFSGFDTDKSADAIFTLGMVQWADMNKNPIFALEVLEELLKFDKRFKLKLAGVHFNKPKNKNEQKYLNDFNAKARKLSDHIEYSGYVEDMNEWYKDIGFILNCSAREGQVVSICEGAATGAIPVIKEWSMLSHYSAASRIYPGHVFQNKLEFVNYILDSQVGFEMKRNKIIHEFRTKFGLQTTSQQTLDLLLEVMSSK